MSNRALALMLAGIVVLFAGVWGGLWWYKTSSDTAKRLKLEADTQAEVAHREMVLRKARESADREAAAKIADEKKASADKARIDAAEKAAKDAKAKAEESRRKRIAVLTSEERQWLNAGNRLRNEPLNRVSGILDEFGGIRFLIRNAELLDDPESLWNRIRERADHSNVAAILRAQKITDPAKIDAAKLRFGIVPDTGMAMMLVDLAQRTAKPGFDLENLTDEQKRIVREYRVLFPLIFD